MPPPRPAPITIPPPSPTQTPSAIIFIHGLGDEGSTFASIASQFQSAGKLPSTTWIFPTAPVIHDLMQNAWYVPSPLPPFPSQRPELDDPEDERGLLQTVEYVESLLDALTAGRALGGGGAADEVPGEVPGEVPDGCGSTAVQVPAEKIILAGFSQGCAVSLLLSLVSTRYAGKLAGIAGFAGYLPLAEAIARLRTGRGLPPACPDGARPPRYFLARGKRDMLVPKRFFRVQQEKLLELGVGRECVEAREYDGMGHALGGACLRDFCTWAEAVLGGAAREA